MLPIFRHQKAYTSSLCVAVFTILISILMPMAHGGSDHEKNTLGFLATLCTSNGVIQVDLNTTADQPQPAQQTTVELSTKCTFCNYLEHDEMIVLNTTPHAIYTQLSARNPSGSQLLLAGSLLDSSAIRAPPQT